MQPQLPNINHIRRLPKELKICLLLRLPYREIMILCQNYPELNSICNDNKFWAEKSKEFGNYSRGYSDIKLPPNLRYYYIMLNVKAAKVARIIRGDDDVNRLILTYTIDDEELEVLFYIIEKPEDIRPKINQALTYAANEGKVAIMRAVLNRYSPSPASINWEDILTDATSFGQINVIREFIQYIFKDKSRTETSDIGDVVISEAIEVKYFDIIYLILSSTKYPLNIINKIVTQAAIFGELDFMRNLVETYDIKHIYLTELEMSSLEIYEYLLTHLEYTQEEVTNTLYNILSNPGDLFPQEASYDELILVFKEAGANLTKVLNLFIPENLRLKTDDVEYLKNVIKALINNGAKISKTNYKKIKDILSEQERKDILSKSLLNY